MHNHNNRQNKHNVLIIDDDATIRLLMNDALTDDSYNISEFKNGFEALEHIEQHHVDLILLDVNMPGMNGFEVCTRIRQLPAGADISIVMVTALEDAASISKSYDLGATDFISKPINWDTFPYRIQYLIKARDAIVEIKHHKSHLEYMEFISRIITQNKTKENIMQETMFAMLDIFSADRAMLLKPDVNGTGLFTVDCETASSSINSHMLAMPVVDVLQKGILNKVDHSEYPIFSRYNQDNPAPVNNSGLKQQLISALNLKQTQNWYLIIQQNTTRESWTPPEHETFYKISLRITNMLSRYLLTEKLHQNEDLLKQAQKLGHLGNWHWNSITNKLTWSDEVYRIYKVKRDEYIPDFDHYFEICFEEDTTRLNLFKAIQNKTSHSYKITHRIRTPDNGTKWLHEQCLGVYDENGELLEINGIVQDITESHNKKEQEVHDNKMDAIGQLTSGLAHDFGNFMTVARGNLELLEERMLKQYNAETDDMELLEDAYSAVNDSVELIKQLLAFSRKKSIAPMYVNVQNTINKFKKLFQNTLGDSIKLSIEIHDDLFDILVDPAQFESTLLNIIINARNAMPNGGEISINAEVRKTAQSRELIRNEEHDLGNECICIYIKDNGSGMSEDVLKRAIEPFYTTQTNQGTGLGLSMVYGFIKQSKGELIIHSLPGRGTTIYLQFPIYHDEETSTIKKVTTNTLHLAQATILIVEDRPTVRQFAVRCLNYPGINILEADDASSAKKILKTNEVDLLFTDILMPGELDGYELSSWASQEYPNLKILLTTAMENKNNKTIVRSRDFQLLPKPYSKSELTRRISAFFTP